MIKNKNILILIAAFLLGIFFIAYQNEWIVLRLPQIKKNQTNQDEQENKIIKKNINLFFWRNAKWINESIEIIWTNSKSENCYIITSSWLNLLDEEKILDKKVSLQGALMSANGNEIYLSFDRNIFNEESSTFEKLMIIEGLLKTLRDNNLEIQKVWFLIHNQEMKDNHLDFSHAWPLTGFTQSKN